MDSVRDNIRDGLFAIMAVSNVIGILIALSIFRAMLGEAQNARAELKSWKEGVWVIAEAQMPTGMTTSGLSIDEHPATLVLQQKQGDDPAELVERTRLALHRIEGGR